MIAPTFRRPIAEVDGPTDAQLLAAHVAGDDRAFTLLMERHADRLWAVAIKVMNNAEAWHWASCDAGVAHVGRIGRQGHERTKKTTRPWAEKYGITEVTWIAPQRL